MATLTAAGLAPIQVLAIPGTNAARQLEALTSAHASLAGLRNIDLTQAPAGRYMITLIAIDIQPEP